jgi:GNAT superfamily N-acetyltransferase
LHEVEATEALLQRMLFGEKPYAEVIISHFNGAPMGFALFFHNFSTFLTRPGIYLEDLFVRPEGRGKGIGKKMFVYLAKLAQARHCGRLEWRVLDWNELAIGFYKKIGATPLDDWTPYRVSGRALDELAED